MIKNKKREPMRKFSTRLYQKRKDLSMKRKIKLNKTNFIILVLFIISSFLLLHDLVFWGILPIIKCYSCQLTYFGIFTDLIAIITLELSSQIMSEWFI